MKGIYTETTINIIKEKLLAGRPGFRIRTWARDCLLRNVHTVSGAHQDSYSIIIHLILALRLRKSGATFLFSCMLSWNGQVYLYLYNMDAASHIGRTGSLDSNRYAFWILSVDAFISHIIHNRYEAQEILFNWRGCWRTEHKLYSAWKWCCVQMTSKWRQANSAPCGRQESQLVKRNVCVL